MESFNSNISNAHVVILDNLVIWIESHYTSRAPDLQELEDFKM